MDDAPGHGPADAQHRDGKAGLPAAQPQALLRDVVERTAQLGSWSWQPARGELHWSRNLYLLFGLDPAGAPVGFEQAQALFAGDSLPRLRHALQAAIESCGPFELEVEFLRAGGCTAWISGARMNTAWYGRTCVFAPTSSSGISRSTSKLSTWRPKALRSTWMSINPNRGWSRWASFDKKMAPAQVPQIALSRPNARSGSTSP